ncbi:nucleolar protein 16 [Lutzomyia longipalpis]|uniref:nucleolar protein 16 n=1 Tax=Lutzomyia longipalpis TaxID=7200 RepID=UPI0024842799|nr:nucleolar protein 16 [Lutzomyia longipalpis]
MVKVRKQRRKKTYNYSANRKRMNKKQKKDGTIRCPEVEDAWQKNQPVSKNFRNMGLSSDPNAAIPFRKTQRERVRIIQENLSQGIIPHEINSNALAPEEGKKKKTKKRPPKGFVAKKLEENANAPRESGFRFSKGQESLISYYLDKYQLNYRAMVNDRKNIEQETWKQLRRKIRKFLTIQEHVDKYLKARNLERLSLEEETDDSD